LKSGGSRDVPGESETPELDPRRGPGGEAARLRRQLAVSEARFRSIVECSADGIVIVNEAGEMVFVNPAAESLFGRRGADLLGHEFGFAVMAGETTEVDIVRPRGSAGVVAELRASDTTWEEAPAQLIMLRDITERRREEERAQRRLLEEAGREQAEQANRRAQFLVEAGAALDSSLDTEVTLTSLARQLVPRLADACAIDLREGNSIRRVAAVHADAAKQPVLDELRRRYPLRPDSPQPAARVLRSGTPELHTRMSARLHEVAVDDDHRRLMEQLGIRSIVSVPLQARAGTLGVITLTCGRRDFSRADVAVAEEIGVRAGHALENAQLYEAALAANRAKADFLAVMSHELRTPLNAIMGYVQLLLDGVTGEVSAAQRHQLERVLSSATELLTIIEEILTFASTETGRARGERRDVRIGDVVAEIVAIARPLAVEKELRFVVDVADEEVIVYTDPGKVRQIAVNLLTNAVKFTGSGTITLCVDVAPAELVLQVTDTGSGIAASELEAIFEPFQQIERPLTRHAGGTGLGLTVSKRLVDVLGGTIDVDSEVGRGSTFTVRLPLGPA